ncbi:MAG: response regulator [Actinomycetota bacterium]|nr:response regulator [Actinomycetota bacterium]
MPTGSVEQLTSSEQAEAAMATIWAEHREAVLERVGVLELAVATLTRRALDEDLRAEAEREAHKLAGVLGTFGFGRGSERAREMELILESPEGLSPARAPFLRELVDGLREELDDQPVEGMAPAPSRPWEEAPLIVVVDDDSEVTARLAEEATRRGMRVQVAATPAAGRKLAEAERPDAVLLDLTFSNGTAEAYQLLSELAGWSPPVPVLVFTVRDGFTDRMEVARSGASGFLQKSLPASEAIDQVTHALERLRPSGTRLLAVDDDPAILAAVEAVLEPHGLAVTTLAEPMRFWEELERVSPALLLLDVDMPGASGIELCQTLRNDPRWAAVPVMFLTARQDPDTIQQIFAAGGDDYMMKPIVSAELVTRIQNRLDRFRLHRALAETDGLTGLQNRRTSGEALGQLVQVAERSHQPLCVVELDLDRFKKVNDRHGHAVGDTVLRRFGELLLRSVRGDDVVGRWGGEEFVLGMCGMARNDGVQRVAQLLERFRQEEFKAGDETFHVSFSAGVAEYPSDGRSVDSLYRAADDALYRAKSAGRDRVVSARQTPDRRSDLVDVVVVEDDSVIGSLLMQALETRGYQARWLKDGAEAAAALTGAGKQLRAGVVLLDVDLPGLDGVSVLSRLHEDGATRRTRVVMLTARSSEAVVLKTLELGAFDHVAKPFSVPILMQKIRRALEY